MPKQTFFNLSEEKRRHILDCAMDEFAEYGYEKASVSRIVDTAGIAKGSFYQYFENLDDLYAYVAVTLVARHKYQLIKGAIEGKQGLTITEFFRTLLFAQMNEYASHPQLMKISADFLRNRTGAVQQKIMRDSRGAFDDMILAYILQKKEQGEIRWDIDPHTLYAMLESVSQRIGDFIVEHGLSEAALGYIARQTDNLELILTHGIFARGAEERGDE